MKLSICFNLLFILILCAKIQFTESSFKNKKANHSNVYANSINQTDYIKAALSYTLLAIFELFNGRREAPKRELILERFSIVDANKDSVIDQIEALNYVNEIHYRGNVSLWFNKLDLNKNGFIENHELFDSNYITSDSLFYLAVKLVINLLFFYNKQTFC